MSTFAPKAPVWYRPVLRTQAIALDLVFTRRRAAAVASNDEIVNWAVNRIGGQSAERAVPNQVEGWVLAQHLSRYGWALPRVEGKRVVDLGSGSGYGTQVLSFTAKEAEGIELDPLAVKYARERFPSLAYTQGDLCSIVLPAADVAVCFEVLEHVHDPGSVLDSIRDAFPRLLLSFPNPLFAGSHLNPHHVVDWPLTRVKKELRARGGVIVSTHQHSMRGAGIRRGAHVWSATWLLDVQFS